MLEIITLKRNHMRNVLWKTDCAYLDKGVTWASRSLFNPKDRHAQHTTAQSRAPHRIQKDSLLHPFPSPLITGHFQIAQSKIYQKNYHLSSGAKTQSAFLPYAQSKFNF